VDALAILPIRNDAPYVANCLRSLIREGLAVAVIDNDSTDGLDEILARPEFHPHLVDRSRLPFRGTYEVTRIWAAVDEVASRMAPDWVVYVDADEVLHSYSEEERVVDVLIAAEAAGCNAVNFDEFVFLPVEHDYVPDAAGWQPLRHYYFFEPRPTRLVRARRHDAGLSMAASGTHGLRDPRARIFSRSLANRHYLFRSAEHARTKYPERRYSAADVEHGWHLNRVEYGPRDFEFPSPSRLKRLAHPDDRRLDRSEPWRRHYWERPSGLGERALALARRAGRSLSR